MLEVESKAMASAGTSGTAVVLAPSMFDQVVVVPLFRLVVCQTWLTWRPPTTTQASLALERLKSTPLLRSKWKFLPTSSSKCARVIRTREMPPLNSKST